MTDRIQEMLRFFIAEKKHHALRKPVEDPFRFAKTYQQQGLSDVQRSVARLHVKRARALVLPCEGGRRVEPLYCRDGEAVFEAETLPGRFVICRVER